MCNLQNFNCAEILRPQHFVVVCELTSILDDILSTILLALPSSCSRRLGGDNIHACYLHAHAYCIVLYAIHTILYATRYIYNCPKNMAASQLITRSTRHRSTRHPVNSSRSRLVTKRRSTRHKQTTNTHQSRTAAAVITLARSPRSPPLLKKCTRN